MALLEKTITVNVAKPGAIPKVFAVQSDSGRIIYCEVSDWDLPSGATAKALVRLPTGEIVESDCEIDGNTVAFTLTSELLAEKGKAAWMLHLATWLQL